MRVAFVGVKRKYLEFPEGYRDMFTKTHLELPFYFARDGKMDVTVVNPDWSMGCTFQDGGLLFHTTEEDFQRQPHREYEVIVHWRKWFPEFYRPEAINVINCQDHSFSDEWKSTVLRAWNEGKLHGILCFPTWHKRHVKEQFFAYALGVVPKLIDGLTLGVDTEIYQPSVNQDSHQMLWASDPGRGLQHAVMLAIELNRVDRRFRLNVCYPDYCQNVQKISHPAINWHGNVSNGPKLWSLFNQCGILPYTSTFMEPSSRAHRQAMAAGAMVLYPPGMGSPSELIEDAVTGFVRPVKDWSETIRFNTKSGLFQMIGQQARKYAVSENWEVQAKRFRNYFEGVIGR